MDRYNTNYTDHDDSNPIDVADEYNFDIDLVMSQFDALFDENFEMKDLDPETVDAISNEIKNIIYEVFGESFQLGYQAGVDKTYEDIDQNTLDCNEKITSKPMAGPVADVPITRPTIGPRKP